MPKMIQNGGEMIRINPANNHIEYSRNRGLSWNTRCSSSSYGEFYALLQYGDELLVCTSKGVYYSRNAGISWNSRCTSSSYGTFTELMDGGNELLAATSKGLYYSKNKGISWNKRS